MGVRRASSALLVAALAAAGCACKSPPAAAPVTRAGPPAAAAPAWKTQAEPTTPEGCRACGGDWGVHGLAPEAACLCRTADTGKRCRDDDECDGQCIGDGDEREVTDPGPPPRGYFVGRCSEFRTTFGCHRFIAAGALKAGPARFDEPVPELCVD